MAAIMRQVFVDNFDGGDKAVYNLRTTFTTYRDLTIFMYIFQSEF